MKYLSALIIGSLFLGIIATIFSADLLATMNLGSKIGYGIGMAITPWVCALFLTSVKFPFIRMAKRNIRYAAVLKFDVGIFLAMSFCMQLGLVSYSI